jgi:PHD/YefM family antitoxin component YafN of YafNO toxin-antitoxin module
MAQRARETRTVAVPTRGQEWRELIDLVRRDDARIVVTDGDTPVAVLVSTADLQHLEQLDDNRRALAEAIDRLREAFKDVPAEEIEREVAKAIREVRAEDDRERRRPTSAA